MYNLAATSKQSVLDLINAGNGTAYTLSQLTLALPADVAGSGFNATLETTNTVVELTNVDDTTDKIKIGYHRLDGASAFGDSPSVSMVLDGTSDADVISNVVKQITAQWGMPLEAGTYTAVRDGTTVTVTFTGHYVLSNASVIALKGLIDIAKSITVVSTTSGFASGEDYAGPLSSDAMITLINATNSTTFKNTDLSFSKPAAMGNSMPSDQVTVIGVAAGGYGGKVAFSYMRLNIETELPNGLDFGSFATLNDFIAGVTTATVAAKITETLGIPVAATELKVRNHAEYNGNFTASCVIVDNYVMRSAGGITVKAVKTASN